MNKKICIKTLLIICLLLFNINILSSLETDRSGEIINNEKINDAKLSYDSSGVVPVSSITVTSDADEISDTETLQMIASVSPDDATNKEILWSVLAGTGEATISSSGLLTPTKPGTVTVRAVATDESGVFGSKVITIKQTYVTNISINDNNEVQRTKTLQLSASITPNNAYDKSVDWSITNVTGTATISSSGELTANSVGTVIVRATAKDRMEIYDEKEITIIPLAVSSISIIGSDQLIVGDSEIYNTVITPSNADDKSITWSITSGNGNATINSDGLLTTTNVGTVTIKATGSNGKYGSKTIKIVNSNSASKVMLTADNYYLYYNNHTAQSTTIRVKTNPTNVSIKSIKWSVSHTNSTYKPSITPSTADTAILSYGGYSIQTATVTATVTTETDDVLTASIQVQLGSSLYGYNNETHINSLQSTDSEKILEIGDIDKLNVIYSPDDSPESDIIYSISDASVAHIDSNGRIYAKGIGYATIYAYSKYNQKTISIPISVVEDKTQPLKIVNMSIEGDSDVERDTTVKYTVAINPINADNQKVTWSITKIDGDATIDQEGNLTANKDGQVLVKATAQDGSGIVASKLVTISRTYINNITINSDSSVERSKKLYLTATVTPDNAYNKELTWSIIYGTGQATIDENGVLTAVKEGSVTVRVNSNDGSNIYVDKEITITPIYVKGININGDKFVVKGKKYYFDYNISNDDADDKSVVWSVENGTGQATISQDGVFVPTAVGEVVVKATASDRNTIYDTINVTINEVGSVEKIAILSPKYNMQTNSNLQLTAIFAPSNVDNKNVVWSVDNTIYATISSNGLLSSKSVCGAVTVRATAKDGSGVYGETKIYIASNVINVGEVYTDYVYVNNINSAYITSSNSNIATASFGTTLHIGYSGSAYSYDVKIRGIRSGNATINLIVGNTILNTYYVSVNGTAGSMSVDKDSILLGLGETDKLNVSFTESTYNYYYVSSDESVVSVDSRGNVKANGVGDATIDVYSEYYNLHVSVPVTIVKYTSEITLSQNEISLNNDNSSYKINYTVLPSDASNKKVVFTSENERIASVSDDGTIYAIGNGETYVVLTSEDGKATNRIKVTVANLIPCEEIISDDIIKVTTGDSNPTKVNYEISPSGSNPHITFAIEDTSVATISNDGYLTGIKPGETTLKIYANNKLMKEITVNVNNYVKVKSFNIVEDNVTLTTDGKIKEYQLNYKFNEDNVTNSNITWVSSDEDIATVDENGKLVAKNIGSCVITGTTEEGNFVDTVNVNVIVGYTTVNFYTVDPYYYFENYISTKIAYYGEKFELEDNPGTYRGWTNDSWYYCYWQGNYPDYYNEYSEESLNYSGDTITLYLKRNKIRAQSFEITNTYFEGNYFYLHFKLDPQIDHYGDGLYNSSLYGLNLVYTDYDGYSDNQNGEYYAYFELDNSTSSSYISIYHQFDDAVLSYSANYKYIDSLNRYMIYDYSLGQLNEGYYRTESKYTIDNIYSLKVKLKISSYKEIYSNNEYLSTQILDEDIKVRSLLAEVVRYDKNRQNEENRFETMIYFDNDMQGYIDFTPDGGYNKDKEYYILYHFVSEDGKIFAGSSFDSSNIKLAVPVLYANSNSYDSNIIKISNRDDFGSIRIYSSKTENGQYSYIGSITDNRDYYIDRVDSYDTYYYKATGVTNGFESDYSESYYHDSINKSNSSPRIDKPVVTKKVTKGTSVKFSWKKVDGAAQYFVLRCNSTGNTCSGDKSLNSKYTSYTIKKLKPDKTYYYKVEVCSKKKKGNVTCSYSDLMVVRSKPKNPSLKVTEKKYNSVNLKIGKASSATYYEVYRSTNKKKGYKKILTTVDYGNVADTSVITSKTYYYKVRACNENACSSYSKIVSAKPMLKTPSIVLSANENKQSVISYNNIEGASGYEIYRSTYKNKKFKLVGASENNNYVNNVSTNKKYYYKVRAYIVIGNKKYYSSYSKVKSIKIS